MITVPPVCRRQSIRLQDYDYTNSGAYFVTIVTHQRRCILGKISDTTFEPSRHGQIVADELDITPLMRPEFAFDVWLIMPNHVHAIIVVDAELQLRRSPKANSGRTDARACAGPRSGSLGAMIAGFKATVTKGANIIGIHPGHPLWQRNYYEHIIRDEKDLEAIRTYIEENPFNWASDSENSERQ